MPVILGLYIGSIALSSLMLGITSAAYDKRLEREGYHDITKDISIVEKIREYSQIAVFMAIPIINIVLSAMMFFNDDYEKMLSDCLAKGTIVRKTNAELLKEQEKNSQPKQLAESQTKTTDQNKATIEKAYSEMTPEEKVAFLRKEMEFWQSINNRQPEKTYNDRGVYKKNK